MTGIPWTRSVSGCHGIVGAVPAVAAEFGVERYLDSVRDDPARLDAFPRELPKG
ncbi:hypothetical protein [Saccharothrix luteola]|uniref:hypothetical protein n=1 Tax=Saccharothrix luteola TaxID=2893018 RepID=UPI001E30E173|nr:hypothetical protein [Saccharothrix luteola]MCC8242800.1 hypothetical protein [Saccharothrix luteola]